MKRKIVRLTESDLVRLVKRVIREEEEEKNTIHNNFGFKKDETIDIPEEFGNLRRRVGSEASSKKIINMWNEDFLPEFLKLTRLSESDNLLVGLRKNGFVNMSTQTFPVDTILKDLDVIYDRKIEYRDFREYMSNRYDEY
jgi:hypothetical protein